MKRAYACLVGRGVRARTSERCASSSMLLPGKAVGFRVAGGFAVRDLVEEAERLKANSRAISVSEFLVDTVDCRARQAACHVLCKVHVRFVVFGLRMSVLDDFARMR